MLACLLRDHPRENAMCGHEVGATVSLIADVVLVAIVAPLLGIGVGYEIVASAIENHYDRFFVAAPRSDQVSALVALFSENVNDRAVFLTASENRYVNGHAAFSPAIGSD